jgi:8-hydroxy-5-deazaflavin:NADPH oxidoreductase
MRIGIIGAGKIGGTLARLFAGAGHDVVIGNSRGPDAVAELVAEIGDRATGATAADAARAGEVVIVAVPFGRHRDLPAAELAGKIVVDAMNYYPNPDNHFAELDDGSTSSSELVAAALPGARLVKAVNTIYFVHLTEHATPPGTPGRRAIPIAGDDEEAKRVVAGLLDDIGFDTFDAGSLADSRRIQPGTPVYNVRLTRDEVAAALA